MADVRSDRSQTGAELLEAGALYTFGKRVVQCVSHAPGEKPRLRLKPYPAWFIGAMAKLYPGTHGPFAS